MALVWIPGCSSYPVLGAVASPYFTGKDRMRFFIAWVQMAQHRPLLCISSLVKTECGAKPNTEEEDGARKVRRGCIFGEEPLPLPLPYALPLSGRAPTSVDWDTLPACGWYGGGGRVSVTAKCSVSVRVDRPTAGGEWDINRLWADDPTVTDYSGTVWSVSEGCLAV